MKVSSCEQNLILIRIPNIILIYMFHNNLKVKYYVRIYMKLIKFLTFLHEGKSKNIDILNYL